MKYFFAVFSLYFLIILTPACKKKGNIVPVITDSVKTDSVIPKKPTPIPKPTITYPYIDTFYGQATEGDWSFSEMSWPPVNVHVYVYHDTLNRIIISSDNIKSLDFGGTINIAGTFAVDSSNSYSYSNLSSDGWGITYNFKLTGNTLIYNYSYSRCPDDDILYYSGTK